MFKKIIIALMLLGFTQVSVGSGKTSEDLEDVRLLAKVSLKIILHKLSLGKEPSEEEWLKLVSCALVAMNYARTAVSFNTLRGGGLLEATEEAAMETAIEAAEEAARNSIWSVTGEAAVTIAGEAANIAGEAAVKTANNVALEGARKAAIIAKKAAEKAAIKAANFAIIRLRIVMLPADHAAIVDLDMDHAYHVAIDEIKRLQLTDPIEIGRRASRAAEKSILIFLIQNPNVLREIFEAVFEQYSYSVIPSDQTSFIEQSLGPIIDIVRGDSQDELILEGRGTPDSEGQDNCIELMNVLNFFYVGDPTELVNAGLEPEESSVTFEELDDDGQERSSSNLQIVGVETDQSLAVIGPQTPGFSPCQWALIFVVCVFFASGISS